MNRQQLLLGRRQLLFGELEVEFDIIVGATTEEGADGKIRGIAPPERIRRRNFRRARS